MAIQNALQNKKQQDKTRLQQSNWLTELEKEDKVVKLINASIQRNQLALDSSAGILNSEILINAPRKYFSRFNSIVQRGVEEVQERLSKGNKTGLISDVQKDPTNENARALAKDAIVSSVEIFMVQKADMIRGLNDIERRIVTEMIENEIMGLGPLEPFWNDSAITEIICNGPKDVQIEVNGNVLKVESCQFRDSTHLQNLISRLYNAINKDVTPTNPIDRGRLRDNSRMMAVHSAVAPNGPNFNIRRHSEKYWSPVDIIAQDTADIPVMEFLGNLVYNGISFLVSGGTGTGKTTLLNALTGFYRDDARLVLLEENLELKPHPKKLMAAPMECIPPKPGAVDQKGIVMRDLVRASLQMRPEGIIIGEVTDHAAYDLCQAMNTGHFGASTIHSNSPEEAMYKMMSLVSQAELIKGEGAYSLIAAAFDIIIQLERFPHDGSRKIVSIVEVDQRPSLGPNGEYELKTTPLWKYVPEALDEAAATKVIKGKWEKVNDFSSARSAKHHMELSTRKTWEELSQLSSI